jgi:hypothetical protein
MACDVEVFPGITQAVFDCMQTNLKAEGVSMSGNSGELDGHGIVADYVFDPVAQTLTVTVQHKPWYVGCEDIAGAVRKALTACGDTAV